MASSQFYYVLHQLADRLYVYSFIAPNLKLYSMTFGILIAKYLLERVLISPVECLAAGWSSFITEFRCLKL